MKAPSVWPEPAEIEKMKAWLGQGEIDIDLMIRCGAMTVPMLVSICYSLTDSPWYQG